MEKIKLLIIGQCQGGNALAWSDFLKNYHTPKVLHYFCRGNKKIVFHTARNKKVFSLYRSFEIIKIEMIWKYLISWYILPVIVKIFDLIYRYDAILIQGNYEPKFNYNLIKSTRAKSLILIYGSDFYQKYLKGNASYKSSFEKVIDQTDHILFNHKQIFDDFNKHISIQDKSSIGCMGINDFWIEDNTSISKEEGVIRLLSTRAMYDFNNILLLVQCFKELYANNPKYELYIINGYGWHEDVKNEILKEINGVKNIITRIGEWIEDEELRSIYDRCDYNFCIGDTDQLSVSIMYGYLRGCINILSPLPTYKDLIEQGFSTQHILERVSKEDLLDLMQNLPKSSVYRLKNDQTRAAKQFLFRKSFRNTEKIIEELITSK